MDEVKTCTACGAVKPLTDFTVDRHRPDGRRACCRTCWTAKARIWRQLRGPEYARAQARKYYQHHRAERRAAQAAYIARLKAAGKPIPGAQRHRPPKPRPPPPPPPPPAPPAPPARTGAPKPPALHVRDRAAIDAEIRALQRHMRY